MSVSSARQRLENEENHLDSFVIDERIDRHCRSAIVGSVGLLPEFRSASTESQYRCDEVAAKISYLHDVVLIVNHE